MIDDTIKKIDHKIRRDLTNYEKRIELLRLHLQTVPQTLLSEIIQECQLVVSHYKEKCHIYENMIEELQKKVKK